MVVLFFYNEKSIPVGVETLSREDQITKMRFQRKHTTRWSCGGHGHGHRQGAGWGSMQPHPYGSPVQ